MQKLYEVLAVRVHMHAAWLVFFDDEACHAMPCRTDSDKRTAVLAGPVSRQAFFRWGDDERDRVGERDGDVHARLHVVCTTTVRASLSGSGSTLQLALLRCLDDRDE